MALDIPPDGPVIIYGDHDPEGVEPGGGAWIYLRETAGVGTTLYVKETAGVGTTGWRAMGGAPAAHALLSASHADTQPGTVVRGDVLIGDVAPQWTRLPLGPPGSFLRSNGQDVAWGTDGSALTGVVAVTVPHPLLSPEHDDTLPAAVVRGSLIVGDATPQWRALGVGVANSVLAADGTDAGWTTTPTVGSLTVAGLTPTRVPFVGVGGLLTDDGDLTFVTDTLSATKVLAPTSVSTPSLISTAGIGITPAAGSSLTISLSTTGDFIVNTNVLVVDTSTGRVGVGTAAPAVLLDVSGTIRGSTGIITGDLTVGTDTLAVDAANGWVGIGTAAPNYPLQIVAASGDYGLYVANGAAAGSSYGVLVDAGGNASDFALHVRNRTGGTVYFTIRGDGSVGIGAGNKFYLDGIGDTYLYEVGADRIRVVAGGQIVADWYVTGGVAADVTMPGVYNETDAGAVNVTVDSAGRVRRSTSSARYKRDILPVPLAEARRVVLALRPVTYRALADERAFAGFIAEDVAQVEPRLATYDADGTPNYVTYDRIPAYLVPVAQDHEARLAALEAGRGN